MGNQYNNTAKIVKIIDTFKFVINRGSNDGVNLGENYLIFVLGEKIFDPDTGEEPRIIRNCAWPCSGCTRSRKDIHFGECG